MAHKKFSSLNTMCVERCHGIHSHLLSLSFSSIRVALSGFRAVFLFRAHTFHCLINFYLTFGSQSAAKNKSQIKKLNARDSNNNSSSSNKCRKMERERDEWRKMYTVVFLLIFVSTTLFYDECIYSLAAFRSHTLSLLSILIFVGVFFAVNL